MTDTELDNLTKIIGDKLDTMLGYGQYDYWIVSGKYEDGSPKLLVIYKYSDKDMAGNINYVITDIVENNTPFTYYDNIEYKYTRSIKIYEDMVMEAPFEITLKFVYKEE